MLPSDLVCEPENVILAPYLGAIRTVTFASDDYRVNLLKRYLLPTKPFHRAYPSPNTFIAAQVDRRVAVDRVRAFIYFRIPKAANSTVSLSLSIQAVSRFEAIEAKRSFARASDLTQSEIDKLAQRFFLFTVARDPFSRIASAYLDKVAENPRKRILINRHLRRPSGTYISFLDFCRFLRDGGLFRNPHWFPQSAFVPCGFDTLHYIGRVETLKVDIGHILERTNPGHEGTLRNWNPHETRATDRLPNLYCRESVEIVRSCYQGDFLGLGYPLDPPWTAKFCNPVNGVSAASKG